MVCQDFLFRLYNNVNFPNRGFISGRRRFPRGVWASFLKAAVVFSNAKEVSTEVDLRGMTFEEAADAVDKYLDDLYLSRMDRATLIHGKGTGALRRKLGDYLKQHPRVKSQRLGDHTEGGSGVTVVTLDVDR